MVTHLDYEQIRELQDVLEDEFATLVRTYVQDAEIRQQMLQQAFAVADCDKGRTAAHSLKGASANLGANELANLCEKVEHACRTGKFAEMRTIVSEVEQEFFIVKTELLKLI